MRFKKRLFMILATGVLLVCLKSSQNLTRDDFNYVFQIQTYKVVERAPGIKYVLQWTPSDTEPFTDMGKGQETFIKRNCSKQNCYITAKPFNRHLLVLGEWAYVAAFDVVIFHGPEIIELTKQPWIRSPNQSYVFVSMESSANYPVKQFKFNSYFNFAWTYKLNSDIYYGYMIIRNEIGKIIGPSTNISWINVDDMLPIKDDIKTKLASKKIAAAWFVSNCRTNNNRSELAKEIRRELEKYNMDVDIYGKCGNKKCPRNSMAECLHVLQRDYYFYFAFENSMSEDYVTEKLLHALQNYAVPVVFGGADYKRFMPDGIYLNAKELSIKELVHQMVGIINDMNRYYNFFKWHNHYSYHDPQESADTDLYCQFCEFINRVDPKQSHTIDNFEEWWNTH